MINKCDLCVELVEIPSYKNKSSTNLGLKYLSNEYNLSYMKDAAHTIRSKCQFTRRVFSEFSAIFLLVDEQLNGICGKVGEAGGREVWGRKFTGLIFYSPCVAKTIFTITERSNFIPETSTTFKELLKLSCVT